MQYNHEEIEAKWQQYWEKHGTYRAENQSDKPKYYVLDMFPYPSGAGLHVGHPLGYIASDIYARYKRHLGFNVLHPMGYDSFGLPAEQYAIQTGQHPAITTAENIQRYRQQLDRMGFSFDWSREVRTSDPQYYRWTQWIFSQLFEHWYNAEAQQAKPIEDLVKIFESEGNRQVHAAHSCTEYFDANTWQSWGDDKKQEILLDYRLAYLAETWVNWCPALGTVLANDEVVDGVSERGGHPVEQKQMTQWMLRITAYSERLLQGLEQVQWSDALIEQQRNWIGKSVGAQVFYSLVGHEGAIEVFTTRPDTIFGVSFMVLAPEHPLVPTITSDAQREEVQAYIESLASKSERERQQNAKQVSGVFTGAYARHPFTQAEIPIWIGEYVLASYGTGAIMAVPCGDQRDFDFAVKFNLPIPAILQEYREEDGAWEEKSGTLIHSDFLSGLEVSKALPAAVEAIEKAQVGHGKVNYRLRDAVFSRQRYWGEPFPVYYRGDEPRLVPDDALPVTLPEVDAYLPTEDGEPPLARAQGDAWNVSMGDRMEYNTMPGWAGSSWYFLRYMDPHNLSEPFSEEAVDYWKNVDLYVGGAEHATGHLLYARFWHKFLKDIGRVTTEEPFQKLINQGMILGTSALIHRVNGTQRFVSAGLAKSFDTTRIHIDVSCVDGQLVQLDALRSWRPEFADATFETEPDGTFLCENEVEKMSKRWHNVVNPDDICAEYGADVLRMYEMFLGPIEQSKPWNTAGITGVHGFVKKFYRLFERDGKWLVKDDEASKEALKIVHKTIKKVTEDIENFSLNTCVSAFMICANELQSLQCNQRQALEPLVILLSPFAPHLAEELWEKLGHQPSVTQAPWPAFEERFIVESSHEYPVMFNGKMRYKQAFELDADPREIEAAIRADERTQKQLGQGSVQKVIVVKGKIINVVVK